MAGRWNEWRSLVAMYRSLPTVLRAQRDIGRARRLRKEGQYSDAFRLAVSAFGVLSQLAAQDNPGASAIVSTDAVFLDELAKQVGQPGAAREELQQALQICQDISGRCPKLEPTLREYIAWYEYRLAEQAEPLFH
jgi:hypothetical protein